MKENEVYVFREEGCEKQNATESETSTGRQSDGEDFCVYLEEAEIGSYGCRGIATVF
jgi:hypothetical protein